MVPSNVVVVVVSYASLSINVLSICSIHDGAYWNLRNDESVEYPEIKTTWIGQVQVENLAELVNKIRGKKSTEEVVLHIQGQRVK